ncbi:hypothetical protein [Microvirga sp. BSC39]|uniref:hypothetical protein n=1 Tax=Microvirga sp. BSC39 TaxID=1549810 RepID=UPI0004E87B48|nr:hypothetical protein [Microvirga sp. BSC39]KFG67855.1 hypothetical protein JH26_19720 [Microvirga sp. BSC39]
MIQKTDYRAQAFTPYTVAKVAPWVGQAMAYLEGKIEKLMSLKGSEPEIATVIGKTHEVFGNLGLLWLLEPNKVLQAAPVDLISQGKIDLVLQLFLQIEHGVYL